MDQERVKHLNLSILSKLSNLNFYWKFQDNIFELFFLQKAVRRCNVAGGAALQAVGRYRRCSIAGGEVLVTITSAPGTARLAFVLNYHQYCKSI